MASSSAPGGLRSLRLTRNQVIMLAPVILALLVGVLFSQRKATANDEAVLLQQQLVSARRLRQAFVQDNNIEALRQELARLKAAPSAAAFPKQEEVQKFDAALFQRVQREQGQLQRFGGAQGPTRLGDLDQPSIIYDITVSGDERAVTGVLGLLNEFPSAIAQGVALKRVEGVWGLDLGVSLPYEAPAVLPPKAK